jgi:hypothetical protein
MIVTDANASTINVPAGARGDYLLSNCDCLQGCA